MAFVEELGCYAVFLWLLRLYRTTLIGVRDGGVIPDEATIAFD